MPKRAARLKSRATRPRDSAHRRGYDRRWQRTSRQWLAEHPLCVTCLAAGRTTAATCVDHIVPHRGEMELFWRETNWQSLCNSCHSAKTLRGE